MKFLISYDLSFAAPQAYQELYDAIQAYGSWLHPLESIWIIEAAVSAISIRDHLQSKIRQGDKLMVVQLRGDWALAGVALKQPWGDWLSAA